MSNAPLMIVLGLFFVLIAMALLVYAAVEITKILSRIEDQLGSIGERLKDLGR